jgi:dTDP-4-dehydrorhamnose 3,5-epimerase-like enzyme
MTLEEKIEIIPRKRLGDERGWFLKIIDGKERDLPNHTGEIYLVSASQKGLARGNHYHNKAKEWFTLLSGEAELKLEDMQTHEKLSIVLKEETPQTVVVPPNVAHAFVNTNGESFMLLAYTDELYDPVDTIPYEV